jgi:DNA-binding NtrC family response regulator
MPMKPTILAIDNDQLVLMSLKMIFRDSAVALETATSGAMGLAMFRENPDRYSIVLVDFDLKGAGTGINGDAVARSLKDMRRDVKVIVLSGWDSAETARACREAGADQFIVKGCDPARLENTVKAMLLSEQMDPRESEDDRQTKIKKTLKMVGSSRDLAKVAEMVLRFADFDEPALILGESGVGKEGVARAIHESSRRRAKPFLAINCAAVPSELLESELFGHERGAFTGALTKKIGLFEQVAGGTIFLDEIGDMPYALQAKILRVLQEKIIQPVGGQAKRIDFRVVAATHRNLKHACEAGEFREDLYYRINYLCIEIPALRERPEDIEPLVEHFLRQMQNQSGIKKEISDRAMRRLKGYSWPGNVRRLEAVVKRAFALADGKITPDVLDGDLAENSFGQLQSLKADRGVSRYADFENLVQEAERALLTKALELSSGVKSAAAEILGISPNTMHSRRLALGLDKPSLKRKPGD